MYDIYVALISERKTNDYKSEHALFSDRIADR